MSDNQKAQQPSYQGEQYADSPAGVGGMINYTYDKFGNEIPGDKPMHENTTAGEGSFHFEGEQYSDGPWQGGYGSNYGVEVGAANKIERTVVDNSRADRGKEA